MAVIKKGILGGIVGNVGQVSGQRCGSKAIIKSKKGKLNQSNKVSGQVQNERFKSFPVMFNLFSYLLVLFLGKYGVSDKGVYVNMMTQSLKLGFIFDSVNFYNCALKTDKLPSLVKVSFNYWSSQNTYSISFTDVDKQRLMSGKVFVHYVRYHSINNSLLNVKREFLGNSVSIGLRTDGSKSHPQELSSIALLDADDNFLTNIYFSGHNTEN